MVAGSNLASSSYAKIRKMAVRGHIKEYIRFFQAIPGDEKFYDRSFYVIMAFLG